MKRPLRPLPPALFAALLVPALAGVQAQTYRSVGPDGKVIYSDRKPTDPQLHVSELGKPVYAPLLAPSTGAFDLRPAARPVPPPGVPANYGLKPAVDVGGQPLPPGLAEAILDVSVHQYFVQSLLDTCGRAQPDLLERFQGGVADWRKRNAEILDKSNRVAFSRLTGEQRDTLRATGRQRLAPLLPSANAGAIEVAAWCARMNADLAQHQFELVGDARLAPLLAFELR